jgi:hypothetical protein
MMIVPILSNHDHTSPPIGVVESVDGSLYVRFRDDMKITKEMTFLIFGDIGFRVLDAAEEDGVMLIRRAQILCWNFSSPSGNVDYSTFDIVFLDGETRRAQGVNFSVACVNAAYQRLQEGAWTHAELGVNEKACRKIQDRSGDSEKEYLDPYEKSRRAHRENY